jgi:hypothetical protein
VRSTSARGSTEAIPQPIDLAGKGVQVAVVRHDLVGDGSALLIVRLGRHAGFRFGSCQSAIGKPGEPDLPIGLHHDDRIEPIAQSVLGEEWDVVDDDGPRRRGGGELGRSGPNEWMHDRIQVVEGVAVSEHDSSQLGAIQLTVRADDTGTESGDDGGKARRACSDYLSSDDVSIDDDRATLAQQGRHRALPRSETAGQPDVHLGEAPCD